ncbi:hypothetical protein [Methanothrix soehngenii]|nr:hypothetical protein [Methanothrix soehngenii]
MESGYRATVKLQQIWHATFNIAEAMKVHERIEKKQGKMQKKRLHNG